MCFRMLSQHRVTFENYQNILRMLSVNAVKNVLRILRMR
jgi:hypothetical protein